MGMGKKVGKKCKSHHCHFLAHPIPKENNGHGTYCCMTCMKSDSYGGKSLKVIVFRTHLFLPYLLPCIQVSMADSVEWSRGFPRRNMKMTPSNTRCRQFMVCLDLTCTVHQLTTTTFTTTPTTITSTEKSIILVTSGKELDPITEIIAPGPDNVRMLTIPIKVNPM